MLLPGNAITVTHMGQELLLAVEGVDDSLDAAHGFLVGKETVLCVLLNSESMPQPEEPKTPEVGSFKPLISAMLHGQMQPRVCCRMHQRESRNCSRLTHLGTQRCA